MCGKHIDKGACGWTDDDGTKHPNQWMTIMFNKDIEGKLTHEKNLLCSFCSLKIRITLDQMKLDKAISKEGV